MSSLSPRPHFPSYVDAVLRHAALDPFKAAIGTEGGVVTYGQLAEAVHCATTNAARAGLKAGSVVGIVVGDPVWHICLICALHRLGVVSVSLGYLETGLPLGLAAILEDAGEKVDFAGQVLRVAPEWFTRPADVAPARADFGPTDLCRIALSSGTTGLPKPIAMSPEILWHRLTTYLLRGRFGVSEKVFCGPPLRSHFAFAIAFAALMSGKMVCFASSAATTVPLVSYFGADLAVISVHQLSELANAQHAQFGGLSSLREIQAGGSTISDALLGKVRAVLACPVLNTYASTEAGTAALAPLERLGALRREGAVGVLAPWAEVVACDEEGRELPPGAEGLLRVSAAGMAPAYQPGLRTVEEPAWFFPGDIGHVTPERVLVIRGRDAEFINIGGNKIAPERIEELVRECSGVADAAVFAVDIKADFPQVWAVVTANGPIDPTAIMRHCAAKLPATTPTVIRVVASIPRNATGKIMRDKLRKELAGG
ncbi:acyl--CoA ligase [Alsobacter sp. SYSU M60028]|uniref:Acyl--CoA ligase n=1 Tax=Alsobacter ponti TaxID=2962936 RepID=A0ABT1LF22_9HYPH|nr:acyl--CoA ligase [Alsobacter ponti]